MESIPFDTHPLAMTIPSPGTLPSLLAEILEIRSLTCCLITLEASFPLRGSAGIAASLTMCVGVVLRVGLCLINTITIRMKVDKFLIILVTRVKTYLWCIQHKKTPV